MKSNYKTTVLLLVALLMLYLSLNFLMNQKRNNELNSDKVNEFINILEDSYGGDVVLKEILNSNKKENIEMGLFELTKDNKSYEFWGEVNTQSDNLHRILTNQLLFDSFLKEHFEKDALASSMIYKNNNPWGLIRSIVEEDVHSDDEHGTTHAIPEIQKKRVGLSIYENKEIFNYLEFDAQDSYDNFILNVIVNKKLTEDDLLKIGEVLYKEYPYHGYLNIYVLKDKKIYEKYEERMYHYYDDMSLADFDRNDFPSIQRIEFIPTNKEQPILYKEIK